jgi:hypothetical protein
MIRTTMKVITMALEIFEDFFAVDRMFLFLDRLDNLAAFTPFFGVEWSLSLDI